MTADDINISGYTCNTCGKIFETEEEFKNRHKKKVTIVKEKKIDFIHLYCIIK